MNFLASSMALKSSLKVSAPSCRTAILFPVFAVVLELLDMSRLSLSLRMSSLK